MARDRRGHLTLKIANRLLNQITGFVAALAQNFTYCFEHHIMQPIRLSADVRHLSAKLVHRGLPLALLWRTLLSPPLCSSLFLVASVT